MLFDRLGGKFVDLCWGMKSTSIPLSDPTSISHIAFMGF